MNRKEKVKIIFLLSSFTLFLSFLIFLFFGSVNLSLAIVESSLFWTGVITMIYKNFSVFYKNTRDIKLFTSIFIIYFVIHELFFGIYVSLTSGIIPGFNLIMLSYSYSQPFTPNEYFFTMASSPSLILFIQGIEVSLTPLSTFYGILISTMLAYSISELAYLRKYKSLASFIPLSSIAIFSASSCCLTLPSLLVILFFSSNLSLFYLFANFLGSWTGFIITYYILPFIAVIGLYLISKSIMKVSKCKLN